MLPPVSNEEKKTFDRQGYVLIENFLGPAHMEKLSAIVDRIYAQWLEKNRAEYVEGRLVNVVD
jgi:hypothetical protein